MHLKSLIRLRHDLHRIPELGFKEIETKIKVAATLRDLGLEVHENVGVIGVLKSGNGNKAIALRAELDALPISEMSKHDYVSKYSGVMHACGHDGHMSMLLGAAVQLAKTRDFDGTVFFIFQPNEEHGLGARAMINEGVLDRFPVEEIYAIHNLPGAPLGQVSTRSGLICSSESLFEINIKGQGGHSAMPQSGVDAITVGSELVQALQTIVSRKIAPGAGTVVSVTEFLSDGQRNILAGYGLLKGDVRTRSEQNRLSVEAFMRQIATGIGQAHDACIDVNFKTEFIETINAHLPTSAVLRTARAIGLKTIDNIEPMSFSEDFAHFNNAVPGCLLLMGNGKDGPNGQPLHSNNYDFNDALLPIGVKFWCALVKDRLP